MTENIYSYDKITILFKHYEGEVKRGIKGHQEHLRRNCTDWFIADASERAQDHGYMTRLEVVAPNRGFLETLANTKL